MRDLIKMDTKTKRINSSSNFDLSSGLKRTLPKAPLCKGSSRRSRVRDCDSKIALQNNPSVTHRSEPPKLISFASGNPCRVPPPFTQGRLCCKSFATLKPWGGGLLPPHRCFCTVFTAGVNPRPTNSHIANPPTRLRGAYTNYTAAGCRRRQPLR